MARAESITFEEFRTRFSADDARRAELFRLRFPNDVVCPKCGCAEYYPVRGWNMFQCHARGIKRLSTQELLCTAHICR